MARDFDGGTSRIIFTSTPLNIAAFTMSLHIQDDGQTGFERVFEMLDSTVAVEVRGLEFDTGNSRIQYKHPWSTSTDARALWGWARPGTGTWRNLVLSYDDSSTSNDPTLYYDGTSQSLSEFVSPSGTPTHDGTDLYFFDRTDLGRELNAKGAELAFWNRVLTSGEAAILGKGFSPLFIPNGLIFYAPIMGRNSPEMDIKGGVTGTLSSTSNFPHPRIIYPSSSQMRGFKYSAGVASVVKDLIGGGFIPFSR